jgi:hypothetical protein
MMRLLERINKIDSSFALLKILQHTDKTFALKKIDLNPLKFTIPPTGSRTVF